MPRVMIYIEMKYDRDILWLSDHVSFKVKWLMNFTYSYKYDTLI